MALTYEGKMFALLKRGTCYACLVRAVRPAQRKRFNQKFNEIARIRGIKSEKSVCPGCNKEHDVMCVRRPDT